MAIAVAAVLILPSYGRLPRVIFSLLNQETIDYGALLRLEFTLIIAVTGMLTPPSPPPPNRPAGGGRGW